MDDLKAFRQLDSLTPGHPEAGHTDGKYFHSLILISVLTGLLFQVLRLQLVLLAKDSGTAWAWLLPKLTSVPYSTSQVLN